MEKHETIYAFIDSQNLNYGTKKDLVNKKGESIYKGWTLDFEKFYIYLKHKFRVKKAFLFIGYKESNKKLYANLKKYGFQLIYKPTVMDSYGKVKGNVDAELVLHASAIEFNNYNKAVIVSGDGDFACLYKFLKNNKKLKAIIIPNRIAQSSLLNNFELFKYYLIRDRFKVEFKRGT